MQGKGRTDIGKNGTAFSVLYVGVVGLAVWGVLAALAGVGELPGVAGLLEGV